MKLEQIRIGTLSAPLLVPFKTALRTRYNIESVLIELTTDTGEVAYGEAPPTGVITGDTKEGIVGALTGHIFPVLWDAELSNLEETTAKVQKALIHNTSAKAAVDIALWDLYGQMHHLSVANLLGGGKKQLTTDITISVNAPEEMARDTRVALERGYDTLKVKVGIDPTLDVERLREVRKAAGPSTRIRIDANQAWKPREAVRILNSMQDSGLNIELVEQPVIAHDLDGLRYVRQNSDVPVLADEAVFSPLDAGRILQMGAADMLNIKLMKCGGITPALQIAAMASVYDVECMMGCMLENKVAVNAAVHVAAARSIITKIDLDGPVLCSHDPVQGGSVFDEKQITVSTAPGLGIQGIEPDFIKWEQVLKR